MQAIQHILTLAIEVFAIAGFGGIYLHHLYTQHTRWMQEHCPPVEPYNPDSCVIPPACVLTCALPESDAVTVTPGASPETEEIAPATSDPAPVAPAPKRTRTRKPKAETTPKATKPRTPRKSKKASLISD